MGEACTTRVQDLPFGGVCPPSELTCPPCPLSAPYKCPSGGCAADVSTCHPNVFLRGSCNATICEEVHWCHILPRMEYACWERSPSEYTAALTFSSIDHGRCATCNHIISRYQCSDCCGLKGVARWSGTYETDAPGRAGGGVFMEGGRWICLLRDVAAGMGLTNVAANLSPPQPPPLPPSPSPPAESTALPPEEAAYSFPMPAEYSLD